MPSDGLNLRAPGSLTMSQPQTPPQKREFRCIHCNGTIAIPFNLPPTTAPCPHCGNTITSPAPESQQASPIPQQPVTAPGPAPAPVTTPTPAPVPAPKAAALDKSPPATEAPTQKLEPERKSLLAPMLLVLLLLAICGGIAWAVIRLREQQSNNLATITSSQNGTIQTTPRRQPNWQTEAYDVLDKFLKGKTVAEKLPYVIQSPGIEERMNDRYGGSVINDIGYEKSDKDDKNNPSPETTNLPEGTPVEGFSTFGSTEEDRARGIYLLSYYRPAHFAIKDFFRPVAPIEVEWGLDDAEPLLALMANTENFTSDSLSAMAFFLRTPDGLKIDWDTFYQTKYKTFETFLQAPEPDCVETFRVVMWEDVDGSGKEDLENRTYHIVPPTGPTGGVRVKVPVDSDLGRKLSVINWIRAKTMPKQITRTATVELKWVIADGEPKVVLNRLICWEFLGIGGKPEDVTNGASPNTNPAPQPTKEAPAPAPAPAPSANGKP